MITEEKLNELAEMSWSDKDVVAWYGVAKLLIAEVRRLNKVIERKNDALGRIAFCGLDSPSLLKNWAEDELETGAN